MTTPLAEQIAREHAPDFGSTPTVGYTLCKCGATLDAMRTRSIFVAMGAHIATVTEQAVREQVAREVEGHIIPGAVTLLYRAGNDGLALAARIARGATP